jgi:glycosyltransferase involved in cell wall biosynthesis
MAALEAHWAGMPMILSDVGAARMLLGDGQAGLLVPNACPDLQRLTPTDVVDKYNRGLCMPNLDALVEAMAQISADPAGWRQRAAVGRSRVEAQYSSAVMSQHYAELFAELVHR